jgi:murein DD-endopeptidase MepM/ murein hydrolase activator NlpD
VEQQYLQNQLEMGVMKAQQDAAAKVAAKAAAIAATSVTKKRPLVTSVAPTLNSYPPSSSTITSWPPPSSTTSAPPPPLQVTLPGTGIPLVPLLPPPHLSAPSLLSSNTLPIHGHHHHHSSPPLPLPLPHQQSLLPSPTPLLPMPGGARPIALTAPPLQPRATPINGVLLPPPPPLPHQQHKHQPSSSNSSSLTLLAGPLKVGVPMPGMRTPVTQQSSSIMMGNAAMQGPYGMPPNPMMRAPHLMASMGMPPHHPHMLPPMGGHGHMGMSSNMGGMSAGMMYPGMVPPMGSMSSMPSMPSYMDHLAEQQRQHAAAAAAREAEMVAKAAEEARLEREQLEKQLAEAAEIARLEAQAEAARLAAEAEQERLETEAAEAAARAEANAIAASSLPSDRRSTVTLRVGMKKFGFGRSISSSGSNGPLRTHHRVMTQMNDDDDDEPVAKPQMTPLPKPSDPLSPVLTSSPPSSSLVSPTLPLLAPLGGSAASLSVIHHTETASEVPLMLSSFSSNIVAPAVAALSVDDAVEKARAAIAAQQQHNIDRQKRIAAAKAAASALSTTSAAAASMRLIPTTSAISNVAINMSSIAKISTSASLNTPTAAVSVPPVPMSIPMAAPSVAPLALVGVGPAASSSHGAVKGSAAAAASAAATAALLSPAGIQAILQHQMLHAGIPNAPLLPASLQQMVDRAQQQQEQERAALSLHAQLEQARANVGMSVASSVQSFPVCSSRCSIGY